MKKPVSIVLALAAVSVMSLGGCNKDKGGSPAMSDSTMKPAMAAPAGGVERGKYLVEAAGGCNDCHTPWKMSDKGPEPDMSRMLSGHPEGMVLPPPPPLPMPWAWAGSVTMTAFSGPWGTSHSANLTPDPETGLGKWDAATFIKTLRTGITPDGKPILPPMPWQGIAKMTDEDLSSIFAYLQSIPAIKNKVPNDMPPMPGAMGAPGGPPMPPPPHKK